MYSISQIPKIKVGQKSSAKNGHILRRRAMRSEYPREFWRKAWMLWRFLLDQKKLIPTWKCISSYKWIYIYIVYHSYKGYSISQLIGVYSNGVVWNRQNSIQKLEQGLFFMREIWQISSATCLETCRAPDSLEHGIWITGLTWVWTIHLPCLPLHMAQWPGSKISSHGAFPSF